MTDIKRYWVNGEHVRPLELPESMMAQYAEAFRLLGEQISIAFRACVPMAAALSELIAAFELLPKPPLSRKRRVLRFFDHQIFGHEGIACECGDGPVGLL